MVKICRQKNYASFHFCVFPDLWPNGLSSLNITWNENLPPDVMTYQWQKLSPAEFHQLQEYTSCKYHLYIYHLYMYRITRWDINFFPPGNKTVATWKMIKMIAFVSSLVAIVTEYLLQHVLFICRSSLQCDSQLYEEVHFILCTYKIWLLKYINTHLKILKFKLYEVAKICYLKIWFR